MTPIDIQEIKDRIISLKGERKWGFEHSVVIDRVRGRVFKTPHWLSDLWQENKDGEPERDLEEMRNSGIEVVPTEVHRDAVVDIAGKGRTSVSYLLEQELYESSREMSFADMFHYQRYRDIVHEQALIGLDMKARERLGLDLLGGKTFALVPKAVAPWIKGMDARVANLLVAEGEVTASRDWSDYGIKQGDVIANEGDVRHCDTRLLDLNAKEGVLGKIRRCIRAKDQEVQDTTLWTLLESFGYKLKYNTQRTSFRRQIRFLLLQALPKMQVYAEAAG